MKRLELSRLKRVRSIELAVFTKEAGLWVDDIFIKFVWNTVKKASSALYIPSPKEFAIPILYMNTKIDLTITSREPPTLIACSVTTDGSRLGLNNFDLNNNMVYPFETMSKIKLSQPTSINTIALTQVSDLI